MSKVRLGVIRGFPPKTTMHQGQLVFAQLMLYLPLSSDGVQLHLIKEPAVAAGLDPGAAGLVKALEQAHDGFVHSSAPPVK
jgi:hypothetical protein